MDGIETKEDLFKAMKAMQDEITALKESSALQKASEEEPKEEPKEETKEETKEEEQQLDEIEQLLQSK